MSSRNMWRRKQHFFEHMNRDRALDVHDDAYGLEMKTLEDPAHELGHRRIPELQIDWCLEARVLVYRGKSNGQSRH